MGFVCKHSRGFSAMLCLGLFKRFPLNKFTFQRAFSSVPTFTLPEVEKRILSVLRAFDKVKAEKVWFFVFRLQQIQIL